jgi:predicted nucleotidyltransferase component of viral defense system
MKIKKLHYETVSELLKSSLTTLMKLEAFQPFKLVGGTALSLQIGHRLSVDIDLFTDEPYGSIDFETLSKVLKENFNYIDSLDIPVIGMGKSFFIGDSPENTIKLDLYYTDKFQFQSLELDKIRMIAVEDIIAMKMDVIMQSGRKKDFWDIHALLTHYTKEDFFKFYEKRNPYLSNTELLKEKIIDFDFAENDFNPICLKNKHWELVKYDIYTFFK